MDAVHGGWVLAAVVIVVGACSSSDESPAGGPGAAGASGSTAGGSGPAHSGGSGGSASGGRAGSDGGRTSQSGTGGGTQGGEPGVEAGTSTGGSVGLDGGDGAVTPTGVDIYVSPTGDDSNPGTRAAPLLTIAKAAGMANPGDRIVLLDGTFDSTTQAGFGGPGDGVDVPDGVTVQADSPRQAILQGSGYARGLNMLGGGVVRDLRFRDFSPAIQARTGTTTVSGSTFARCGASGQYVIPAVSILQNAKVTIAAGGITDYVEEPGYSFAQTSDSAELTIQGGVVASGLAEPSMEMATIYTILGSSLVLDGATVKGGGGREIGVDATSGKVTMKNGATIRDFPRAALHVAEGLIEMDGSTLSGNGDGIEIVENPLYSNIASIVTVRSSTIDTSVRNGITETDTVFKLTVDGSTIENNTGSGIFLGDAVNREVDTNAISLTATKIRNNGQYGFDMEAANRAGTVSMRTMEITGNALSGVRLIGQTKPDLGKVGSAGANVFSGNAIGGAASEANLVSQQAYGFTLFAVGNTWDPNQQGADSQGHYAANGSGAVLEVSSGTGKNYVLTDTILRLAENP